MWIEIHVVIDVVVQLLSGTEMVDGKGMRVAGDEMHSRALQISGKTFFFIEMSEFYDKATRLTWKAMMGEGLSL